MGKLLFFTLVCAMQAQSLRVNTGGPAATDPLGNVWLADTYFTGGVSWLPPAPIPNVPAQYQTLRYGDFTYHLPALDGPYILHLQFIESSTAITGPGQRTFDVKANGVTIASAYDIAAKAGLNVPTELAVPVTAAGSGVTVQFITRLRNAVVSAIWLEPSVPITVSALDGPDACDSHPPTKTPFPGIHFGGHICAVPPPVPAHVIGSQFRDFNFGGVSTVLTPPAATYTHAYSFPSPFSASNRYLAISDTQGGHFVIDRTQPGFTPIRVSVSAPLWDSRDDDVYYTIGGSIVGKQSVATGGPGVALFDYGAKMTALTNGGSSQASADGWFAYWSEPEHTVCALNPAAPASYCADYTASPAAAKVGYSFIDFSMVTNVDKGSGKRYVILFVNPAMAVFSVNAATGKLDFEYRGGENLTAEGFNNPTANGDGVCDPGEMCLGAPHGTVTDIGGIQYIVTVADTASTPCERDLVYLPIAAGIHAMSQRLTVLPLAYCSSGYDWPDFHIGCSPVTGACILSTLTPHPAPYGNQLILIKDPKHVVKLAYSQSVPFGTDTYWYSPRAAISPDGRYIAYDSNFGGRQDTGGYSGNQVMVMRTDSIAMTAPAPTSGVLADLKKCSGSGVGWDCSGLWWATINLANGAVLPLIGSSMTVPVSPNVTWTSVQ